MLGNWLENHAEYKHTILLVIFCRLRKRQRIKINSARIQQIICSLFYVQQHYFGDLLTVLSTVLIFHLSNSDHLMLSKVPSKTNSPWNLHIRSVWIYSFNPISLSVSAACGISFFFSAFKTYSNGLHRIWFYFNYETKQNRRNKKKSTNSFVM